MLGAEESTCGNSVHGVRVMGEGGWKWSLGSKTQSVLSDEGRKGDLENK